MFVQIVCKQVGLVNKWIGSKPIYRTIVELSVPHFPLNNRGAGLRQFAGFRLFCPDP